MITIPSQITMENYFPLTVRRIRLRKATTITDMYAALGQRTIRAVLKRQDGKIVNEFKINETS
ncbi:MAG: hypothetical protein WA364_23560 [Candidatus Nitrosopolaris sp.]